MSYHVLFVLVIFSPFSITITSLGDERANLSAFCTFVRFALVLFCLFPFPLGVWEGLRFVIVALRGLFSYLFFPYLYFGENPHFRQERKKILIFIIGVTLMLVADSNTKKSHSNIREDSD